MNTITKVSDIKAADVAEYLRIAEPTSGDTAFINASLTAAKDYILKYTGIKDATELDKYADMIIVVFVLCQDMFDTRTLYTENSNINQVVDNILSLHARNLL